MRTSSKPKIARVNARFEPADFERLATYAKTTGCTLTDALRSAVRSLALPAEAPAAGTELGEHHDITEDVGAESAFEVVKPSGPTPATRPWEHVET